MITLKKSLKLICAAAALFIVISGAAALLEGGAYASIKPYDHPEHLTFNASGNEYTAWQRSLLWTLTDAPNTVAQITEAKSSNPNVFNTYIDEEGYVVIYPTGVGSASLNIKDSNNYTHSETITVEPGYFQDVLDNSKWVGPGDYVSASDDDWDDEFIPSSKANAGYGDDVFLVCYPHVAGATATLTVGGVDAGSDHLARYSDEDYRAFEYSFLKKLNTKIEFRIDWADASRVYTGKIISMSKIKPYKIKRNSKKGKVKVIYVHKGDYLKIRVGKKFVKTVKIKSFAESKTISWTNKKKMKKGTKVYYYLYNKYKQKLATAKTVVK